MPKRRKPHNIIRVPHHGTINVVSFHLTDDQEQMFAKIIKSHPDEDHLLGISSILQKKGDSKVLIDADADLSHWEPYLEETEKEPKKRRRKADLYVMRGTRWFGGKHAEEMQADLFERVQRWRSEGMTEGEICKQARYEIRIIFAKRIWNVLRNIVPMLIRTLLHPH